MKTVLTAIVLTCIGTSAFAQSTTTATSNQTSASQSVAQGTIQFSQAPADTHSSETVRNVSAPILGAYASSFSQMNCASTTQLGAAVAGFSVGGGTSKDSASCVLEVAAAEMTRQATVDPDNAPALRRAAIGVRCQVSKEVYYAMQDAGFECKRKPAELVKREDDQPESTRVAAH